MNPTNTRDLSQRSGNSTAALQAAYSQLMELTDLESLKQQALAIVQPLVGGKGISPTNWEKFRREVAKAPNLAKLQFYISNYILAGSGMAVREDQISAISTLLTESLVPRQLTKEQHALKSLVESYGYYVGLADTV